MILCQMVQDNLISIATIAIGLKKERQKNMKQKKQMSNEFQEKSSNASLLQIKQHLYH